MSLPEFEATKDGATITDIAARINGRSIQLLGPAGAERELAQARAFLASQTGLPVLLGVGLGHALKLLLSDYSGAIAVIDKETSLESITGTLAALTPEQRKRVTIISSPDLQTCLRQITEWQNAQGQKPLHPLALAFYQRLDPDYYGELRKALAASERFDFWAKARVPRFASSVPRLLLLASKYFLIGEIEGACKKLGLPYKLVMVGEVISPS